MGLFADVDITASGLATLAALASLGGRLQASSGSASSLPPAALGHHLLSTQQSPPNATTQTSWLPRERSERTSPRLDMRKTVFCRGCQRFYSASIYQSHVGISRQLNELTAPGQSREDTSGGRSIPLAELAESAKSLGLVLTAPLITDAGFIYVPVHAACGRQNLEVDLEPAVNGGTNTTVSTTQRTFQSAEASGNSNYQKLTGPYRNPPRQPLEQHTVSTPLDLRIAQQEQQLQQSGRGEEEGGIVTPSPSEEGIRRNGDNSATATGPRSGIHEHQRSAPDNQASEGKNGSEAPSAPVNVLLGMLSTLLSGQRTSKQDSTASTPVSMQTPPPTSSPGLTPDMLTFLMSSLMSYILPSAFSSAVPWFHHARLLASQQHSQPQHQPPPPPVGGYTMEALEAALLQATNQLPISPVSMLQGGLLPCIPAVETTLSGPCHVTGEERNSQDVPPIQPPRPYLCTNCHTRFQAYSTFKAHQQYYCQGRRKMADSCSSNACSSGATLQTSPPTGVVGNIKTCDGSHSPGGSVTKRRRLCPVMCPKPDDRPASGDGIALPGGFKATSASPISVAESESPPHSIRISGSSNGGVNLVNGDWELCGTSELRCRLCGYVGQTPRGMKMHNRLHECSVSATTHQNAKQHQQQPDKAPSPGTKPASTLESNTVITSPICSPQSFRAQPLC
nr:unnamed protein product [Spirometra erinaceieuropaei]